MERFTFSRHMPRSGYGYGYGYGNGFDLNQPETHVSNFEFPPARPDAECRMITDARCWTCHGAAEGEAGWGFVTLLTALGALRT